ncbi:toll/interleukin-1 receptor domain-containing protein [Streptomyces sp. 4N509B]|uniref:toll/interleukin-1 receptor domain-containing protein n=1 Tax=Streptomyces sp. 4N509B TaxID=3457413 RepID=UPI003FD1E1B2
MADAYVAYASEDADWVDVLTERLRAHGVKALGDRHRLLPGSVVVHEVEDAIRSATTGLVVLSSTALSQQWLRQEYAALFQASTTRELRLVPVLLGDAEPPPFAATRLPMDFRRLPVGGDAFDDRVALLARIIRGEPLPEHLPCNGQDAADDLSVVREAPPRPLTAPAEPSVVICHARTDVGYARRLAHHLAASGLPVWTVGSLTWGDDWVWAIRRQLASALAVVVVMSPEAQAAEDVTRDILEGQRHGRPFLPILLRGERHYLLASSWYFDARGGALPGPSELHQLRRLRDRVRDSRSRVPSPALAGGAASPAVPPPPVPTFDPPPRPGRHPAVVAVRAPVDASLATLAHLLAAGEVEQADVLTTTLLLQEAGRHEFGFVRPLGADAARLARTLPDALLDAVDASWAGLVPGAAEDGTAGLHGFRAQLRRSRLTGRGHRAFTALAQAYGWNDAPHVPSPRYETFVRAAASAPAAFPAFFPTLRNPQSESKKDWHDQWSLTVRALHQRLLAWPG